jgi:UDP-GlcNAc:undecaprenyl-phosphate GlcNAc-1-phosphate transferase
MLKNLSLNNSYIFLIVFSLSLLLTPVVRSFAVKFKLVSKPKTNRFHRKVTALLGGVGIFLACFIGFILFVPLNKILLVFLSGAIFIFLWGLADDFHPLKPHVKLLGQIIASCIIIFFGISFNLPAFKLGAYLLTILWMIGITNAFNLLDNMDGLAAGTAVICSLMIFTSSLILNNDGIGIIALILAAACLGFLPYNFNPAKIYMGDSGSMFLGYSLAVICVIGSYKHVSNLVITLAIPVLILAVPIFDTIFVMIMRNIRGRSFWVGGRDHTSHRLVSLGLSERKTVIILYVLSVIFGLIALLYTKIDMMIVSIFAVLTVLVLLFFGIFLSEVKVYEKEEEFEKAQKKKETNGSVIFNTVLLYKRNFLDSVVDLILICVAYYSAYLLKYDGRIPPALLSIISSSLPVIIVIKLTVFFAFGIYSRIWPYMGIPDVVSIFKSVSLSSVLSIVAVTFLFRFVDYSRAIFILDWLILMFLVIGFRVSTPLLADYFFNIKVKEENILIFGAGNTGEALLREIKRERHSKYHPMGFIDDNKEKVGKKINGVPVLGTRHNLEKILKNKSIDEVFVAVPTLPELDFQEISAICQASGIKVRKAGRILDYVKANEDK